MGEAYSMDWKGEKWANNFGPKTRIEETTWKTWT
jgi:hypothetical protein